MALLYFVIFVMCILQIGVRFRIHRTSTRFNIAMFVFLLLIGYAIFRGLYYTLPIYTHNKLAFQTFVNWIDFFAGDLVLTSYGAIIVSW
jgi:hypothetical protein